MFILQRTEKYRRKKYMLFIDYLPAELKMNTSRWYVAYHVKNPQTGKLHRKTIKVNRIENLTERKRYARKLVLEINKKLETGWNPFIEQEAPRGYTKLIEALEIYLRAKTKEFSSKDSIRTYASHVESLKIFVKSIEKNTDMLVISFDAHAVKRYMDYLYNVRNLSGRTYNNYRAFCTVIWNWFVENLYCKVNPFASVKKKMEQTKTRTIIDTDTRSRIREHLLKTGEHEYLAMIMLCFHGLIRPKEICLLKPEYFDFEKRIIFLPAKITKDKDDRIVTISDDLMEHLETLNIPKINPSNYIFSTAFKAGKMLKDARYVGKRWDKLRKELNMPAEYQFYSLKDSGIVQKFQDGINPLDIRNQAGHSSLEQTNAYAKYANPEGSLQIKTISSKF